MARSASAPSASAPSGTAERGGAGATSPCPSNVGDSSGVAPSCETMAPIRRSSWRRPVPTTSWPMNRALLTWVPKRLRPLAAISSKCSNSRSVLIASSAGAKTNMSSSRSAVTRGSARAAPSRSSSAPRSGTDAAPSRSSSAPRSGTDAAPSRSSSAPRSGTDAAPGSDTVAAEPLALVGQLADVLHEEAGATDELVGLLGQDALCHLGAVLGVGELVVLRLVLDDQALLQDHIEAGLDVLVLGLLLVVVLCVLAGGHHGHGGHDGVVVLVVAEGVVVLVRNILVDVFVEVFYVLEILEVLIVLKLFE